MQFGQYQIYVLRNDADLIKIGITQHYDERVKSLSGSNGGGHKIIDEYVSPYTYLYTLENRFHMIYKDNRVYYVIRVIRGHRFMLNDYFYKPFNPSR